MYCMLTTQSMRKTLSLRKSPLPCEAEGGVCASVTVVPELLECYLLLYAAYSG
jgi:hypothetical protein